MHRNSTTPHANHDELLLARLYGGDVNERERAHALELMAACEECAGFFADLGAIATATAEMAVPRRPRDFTLTEADAARLRRRSNGRSLLGWLVRTRALGGSMAAIGLVGVVALGAVSAFGIGSETSALAARSPDLTALGAPGISAAPAYLYGSPSPAAERNGGGTKQSGDTAATSLPGSVGSPLAPAGSPAASSATGGTTQDGSGYGLTGQPTDEHSAGSPAPASSAGGPGSDGSEVRTFALAGSVGLLALGLLLLVAPRLAARKARR